MEHTISPQFRSLLSAFCQSVGLSTDEQALGVEFEAVGHTVMVATDPRTDERLLVEVLIGRSSALPEGLAMLLHQVNDAARLEHDWVATVGAADELRLHTQRAIAQTTPGELESLLAEGVDRAQALASLIDALPEEASGASERTDFDPLTAGMLRA